MADQIMRQHGKNFRVVCRPPVQQYGDTVFVQKWGGSDWQDVCSYNTLSNDYAHTEANNTAVRLARRYEEGFRD